MLAFYRSTMMFRSAIFDTEVCGYMSWGAIPIFAGSESVYNPIENPILFTYEFVVFPRTKSTIVPSLEHSYSAPIRPQNYHGYEFKPYCAGS